MGLKREGPFVEAIEPKIHGRPMAVETERVAKEVEERVELLVEVMKVEEQEEDGRVTSV